MPFRQWICSLVTVVCVTAKLALELVRVDVVLREPRAFIIGGIFIHPPFLTFVSSSASKKSIQCKKRNLDDINAQSYLKLVQLIKGPKM